MVCLLSSSLSTSASQHTIDKHRYHPPRHDCSLSTHHLHLGQLAFTSRVPTRPTSICRPPSRHSREPNFLGRLRIFQRYCTNHHQAYLAPWHCLMFHFHLGLKMRRTQVAGSSICNKKADLAESAHGTDQATGSLRS